MLHCNSVVMQEQGLSVAVIDTNHLRAAILEEGLREAGYVQIVRIGEMTNLLARLSAIQPDVIVIDLENPSRDVLEQMFQVSRMVKRPIAMFVDQSDSNSIRDAMIAGVSAYVVDGLKKERVKHILDMCISRFHVFSRMQEELIEAKSQLADRKVIDRAKGILMKAKGLSEQDAYVMMRNAAMNEKRRISDIAKAIITAADMFK